MDPDPLDCTMPVQRNADRWFNALLLGPAGATRAKGILTVMEEAVASRKTHGCRKGEFPLRPQVKDMVYSIQSMEQNVSTPVNLFCLFPKRICLHLNGIISCIITITIYSLQATGPDSLHSVHQGGLFKENFDSLWIPKRT